MKQSVTQQSIAFENGFSECFEFADGYVYCVHAPEKRYSIIEVEKQPCPCTITKTVVYRITTKDGIKGTAIVSFEQSENY